MSAPSPDRRDFLRLAGSCAGWLALVGAAGPPAGRLFRGPVAGRVVRRAPWGRIEELADGAWALISTPLAEGPDAALTVSNGGIVAGRDGVAVIEGFASEEGARWMAEQSRDLTGRWPTHVILTHYHGDHSTGLAAYRRPAVAAASRDAGAEAAAQPADDGPADAEPTYYSTPETRDDLVAAAAERESPAVETLRGAGVTMLTGEEARTVDLGGRRVRIIPRAGHTRSDLVVELEDPRLVWCGDLVWNGMFPNYMDARPSELSRHVRALLEPPADRWVPGHGALADEEEMRTYAALLDDVGDAARRALEAGRPVEAAAAEYRPPAGLGKWVLFSPRYYEVAFRAWERDLP